MASEDHDIGPDRYLSRENIEDTARRLGIPYAEAEAIHVRIRKISPRRPEPRLGNGVSDSS